MARVIGGKMKAMDLLKSALAERQAKAQKVVAETGQKWIKRGVLEAKRREEYMEELRQEEERQKADEEAHFKRLAEHLSQRKEVVDPEKEKEIPKHILNDALLHDDDAEPPVPLNEVLDRLREMAQPITLFGETDMMRYRRLRNCEKEMHEGKKNPDLVMLENVHMGQQMQALKNDVNEEQAEADNDEEEEDAASDDEKAVPANEDKSDSEDEGEARVVAEDKSDSEDEGETIAAAQRANMMQAAAAEARKQQAGGAAAPGGAQAAAPSGGAAAADAGQKGPEVPPEAMMQVPEVDLALMDKCDFIRAWARKALKAWEKELADKPEEEKKKATVKMEVAAHRQVRRDVRPLQKRLRLYVMEDFLLDKIHNIVKHAAEKEYRNASEAYLDLSIGKAAWPVGIGCGGSMLMEDAIGLHDRFNRNAQVKDIAYALNDEVTRKYVQALKRLMSVAQRYWPPDDPSKAA